MPSDLKLAGLVEQLRSIHATKNAGPLTPNQAQAIVHAIAYLEALPAPTPAADPKAEGGVEPTRQAIWDAVDRLIESATVHGKAADGEYNEHVQTSQRSFIDGLRRARLCVLNLYGEHIVADTEGAAKT